VLFRELVRQRLKEKNLTVLDLSDLTGLSVPYLYDLLRGRRRWNEDTIAKVCEALGINYFPGGCAVISNIAPGVAP